MSYIELWGTIFTLWSVKLISQRKILTWPVSIISVLLYGALFYQIRLYSDALEQIYYLFVSIYGWWRWSRPEPDKSKVLTLKYSSPPLLLFSALLTILLSLAFGTFISRVHLLVPAIFPEPASYPYLDAITTIMSFTAMALMTQKRIESWYYWIIVDLIGIGLYYLKEVKFIALLYLILLVMAINGLRSWQKAAKTKLSA